MNKISQKGIENEKKRLKYMPVGEPITYTAKNKKLVFLNFSLRWLLLNKMPWLADKDSELEIIKLNIIVKEGEMCIPAALSVAENIEGGNCYGGCSGSC